MVDLGKSLAFLLPMLAHVLEQSPLAEGESGPLALVLVPTHELAEQLFVVASQLGSALGCALLFTYFVYILNNQHYQSTIT